MSEVRKFNAEISKVLHLMIHSLYTNKDIFLRELISNSADAIDKLRYLSITDPNLSAENNDYKIIIETNTEDQTLKITDNGIGMDMEDMIQNLGTIAKSGTQNFAQNLTGDSGKDIQLIGQFGVGFYSSFMVASNVEVISRKAGTDKVYKWSSEGTGEFLIDEFNEKHERGTSIILKLKEDSKEFLEEYRIKHIVKTYSDHINIPIIFKKSDSEKVINSSSALWTRPKSEINEEDYNSFYKHIAHAADIPWHIIHNKNEGAIEFTNLLFIPSVKPFDLYHPDRMTRLKLYVKKVFITEENISLLPAYLRFIKGIIDSEDLPLNISRETLQHNNIIEKIRKSIVKKVLSELSKIMKENREKYNIFWENFGPVLKEGLCEFTDNKDELLSLGLFYSSKREGLITLKDYIENMKDKQQNIFYFNGDNIDKIKNSPQLDSFKKRDIEVLLLADHVDDFWVNVVSDYEGKEFKSITRSGIDLNEISKIEEEIKEMKIPENEIEIMISYLKEILGDKIKKVEISKKLTDLPACLAVDEGGMDIRMERFLRGQNQIKSSSQKILEINPEHKILKNIINLKDKGEELKAKDLVYMIFDQACILEGEDVTDISAFANRLTRLMEKEIA